MEGRWRGDGGEIVACALPWPLPLTCVRFVQPHHSLITVSSQYLLCHHSTFCAFCARSRHESRQGDLEDPLEPPRRSGGSLGTTKEIWRIPWKHQGDLEDPLEPHQRPPHTPQGCAVPPDEQTGMPRRPCTFGLAARLAAVDDGSMSPSRSRSMRHGCG